MPCNILVTYDAFQLRNLIRYNIGQVNTHSFTSSNSMLFESTMFQIATHNVQLNFNIISAL
jgi:hypothetical protein